MQSENNEIKSILMIEVKEHGDKFDLEAFCRGNTHALSKGLLVAFQNHPEFRDVIIDTVINLLEGNKFEAHKKDDLENRTKVKAD